MTSVSQRYADQQKKKTLGMLRALAEKIEKGELVVETHGFWQAVQGRWNFRVVALESEDFTTFKKNV